jgi:hypothetical protein
MGRCERRKIPADDGGTEMTDAPHTPAAFINAIAEEGTKQEAIQWLQKIWNELAETKRLLVEAREDVAELLERMKTEGWHRDDRIEWHVALLSRIDAAIKELK